MSRNQQLFLQSLGVALGLTSLTYLVGFVLGWIHPSEVNWYEILGVFTAYSCTFMCVFQTRWNYPMGIISTAFFVMFYWTAEPEPAKALAIFNLYLVFSLIYGYWRWGPDGNTRPVTKVDFYSAEPLIYIAVALGIYIMLEIAKLYGAKISDMEVAIVVASGVAQVLLDNKKLQTWFVWIGVNVASIYFYWDQGWHLLMLQYALFLANAFWGYTTWRKDLKVILNGVMAKA